MKIISGEQDLTSYLKDQDVTVLHFCADWAAQCQQINSAMSVLESQLGQSSKVNFVAVEAEKVPELSMKHSVKAVPTVVIFKGAKAVDRVDGVHVGQLTEKVRLYAPGARLVESLTDEQWNEKLKKLTHSAPVMVFMKGNPDTPRCGFSRQLIDILRGKNISFVTFDILEDEEVRQRLKKFSDWPTYPQVYAKGELVGGLDIIKELVETGELEESLGRDINATSNVRSENWSFDEFYEIERCIQWLMTGERKSVALQFPDDLLNDSVEVVFRLQDKLHGVKFYVLADTSYGNCCVDKVAASHVSADAIIHFGYSCLSETASNVPVLNVFTKILLAQSVCDAAKRISQFVESEQDSLANKVTVLWDPRLTYAIEDFREWLEKMFPEVNIHLSYPHARSEEVETSSVVRFGRRLPTEDSLDSDKINFLFLVDPESSLFLRAFGLVFAGQRVLCYSPSDGSVSMQNTRGTKSLMQRYYLVECVRDAQTVGLLVGTLSVKDHLKTLKCLRDLLKKKRRKFYTISVGKINPEKLANFPEIDVFVLIACAENSLLSSKEFLKPIVTPYELQMALEKSEADAELKPRLEFIEILQSIKHSSTAEEKDNPGCNVSLLTNRLQVLSAGDESSCEGASGGSEIVEASTEKSVTVLGNRDLASNFLNFNRTWRGLELKVQPKDLTLKKGQSGIPIRYENES
ncbi:unnamed protein product [Cyprideis torosa]|uniref:2-(3-amino-3-carboxypropyl)histidine synthase subunit 2 n=1 Tax=Cyprideis torosa TaxID=163714 RepID=A0A7R8ZKE7_9CRUS|nr:unnamed protein product [Cyprideis torosa]CAG0880054.1 unnamed protein product [Cyprideis torosa]